MILSFVDSHCHLNSKDFNQEVDHIVDNAHQRGVHTLLTICTKYSEIDEILAIVHRYPHIFGSVGIHPHEAQDTLEKLNISQVKGWLREYANQTKIIALGETGLDFHYNHSPKLEQILMFEAHIETSLETHLPLSIHTRSAESETIELLEKNPGVTGVIHCFSGSPNLAEKALACGFYISISGIATFKKAEDLRDIIKTVPLDRLLVETDAPYLAPIPYRGQRNEPCLVIHTAQAIANIKQITLEEIASQTTQNFFALFKKAQTQPLVKIN